MMKIKSDQPSKNVWRAVFRPFFVLILCIFVFVFTASVFMAGLYSHKLRLDQTGFLRNTSMIAHAWLHPFRLVRAKIFAEPEKVFVDIKHKYLQRIAYTRELALSRGFLLATRADYVPASISVGGAPIKVKLRLKGDMPDHWETDKWSLRIKIKGDNTVFGMKNFSIQHPLTRNYVGEWFGEEALRREGLISVRYKFVDVVINGKDMGIYALEEHFEKRLIESNGFRDSPILKFDEDLRWIEEENLGTVRGEAEFGAWTSSFVDSYSKDMNSNEKFLKAESLLESFRSGLYSTTDVFDAKKLAVFIALKDLFGSGELDWNDFRFYYNPITDRLEPIGFDFHVTGRKIDRLFSYNGGVKLKQSYWSQNPGSMLAHVFSDPLFFEEYVRALNRVASSEYLDILLEELKVDLNKNLDIVHGEYPWYELPIAEIKKNAEFIRNMLHPEKGIHAYLVDRDGGDFILELGNIQSLPIEVLSVRQVGTNNVFSPKKAIYLEPKDSRRAVDYHEHFFVISSGVPDSSVAISDFRVFYRVRGTRDVLETKIFPWRRVRKDFLNSDLARKGPNVGKFGFMIVDKELKEIIVRPGEWRVSEPIICPSGFTLLSAAPRSRKREFIVGFPLDIGPPS